ncbi:MAG: helix-turn-helix domain-containing protein [Pseudonocardiaceae bacterium]
MRSLRDRESTIRSRELGEGLRQAMDGAGLNGRQAARVLGWSESWVSRLLSGKRGGCALDVAAFLGVCRAKAPDGSALAVPAPARGTFLTTLTR